MTSRRFRLVNQQRRRKISQRFRLVSRLRKRKTSQRFRSASRPRKRRISQHSRSASRLRRKKTSQCSRLVNQQRRRKTSQRSHLVNRLRRKTTNQRSRSVNQQKRKKISQRSRSVNQQRRKKISQRSRLVNQQRRKKISQRSRLVNQQRRKKISQRFHLVSRLRKRRISQHSRSASRLRQKKTSQCSRLVNRLRRKMTNQRFRLVNQRRRKMTSKLSHLLLHSTNQLLNLLMHRPTNLLLLSVNRPLPRMFNLHRLRHFHSVQHLLLMQQRNHQAHLLRSEPLLAPQHLPLHSPLVKKMLRHRARKIHNQPFHSAQPAVKRRLHPLFHLVRRHLLHRSPSDRPPLRCRSERRQLSLPHRQHLFHLEHLLRQPLHQPLPSRLEVHRLVVHSNLGQMLSLAHPLERQPHPFLSEQDYLLRPRPLHLEAAVAEIRQQQGHLHLSHSVRLLLQVTAVTGEMDCSTWVHRLPLLADKSSHCANQDDVTRLFHVGAHGMPIYL